MLLVMCVASHFLTNYVGKHILRSWKICFRRVELLACIKQRKQLRRLLKLLKLG